MQLPENLSEGLSDFIPKDIYQGVPNFGVQLEKPFADLPIPKITPPESPIPLPPGLPEFKLPEIPAVPNISLPKLDIPGIAAPAILNGAFSNLIPPSPSEGFSGVQNDLGDPKVSQEPAESQKSVVAFPVEPQAISKDIAKIAPQVSQDVLAEVVKNTLSLFMGIFVPGKAILDMVLGLKDKAEALGLDKLLGFGKSLENAVNGLNNLGQLTDAMKSGLANSLNQAAGLSDMRQVPVGPRNLLSSEVPQHAMVSDKATRADWPNGAAVPEDVLARIGNSTKMVEDSYNVAASLSSLEKATASVARSASLLAQGLGPAALALQIDGLMRAYSVNSINVDGSLPSPATLLKDSYNAKLRDAVTEAGEVASGTFKGLMSGTATGELTGLTTGAAVDGTLSGKGSGVFSGEVTAEIGKGSLLGGTVNPDGSISGGELTVQSLDNLSLQGATGSATATGVVAGAVNGGAFEGSATGALSNLTSQGNFAGTASALGSTTKAVIKGTSVQDGAGTGSVKGAGTLGSANGSISGSANGTLSGGAVSGGSANGGTIAVTSITNPVYGPTGLLEGGNVVGTASNLAVEGASITGPFAGTASGKVDGLQGEATLTGRGRAELEAGFLNGGMNLGDVPASQTDLLDRLGNLNTQANGAMPGNLMDLAYGQSKDPLPPGYLQLLPGKVADNLGSPNGRLIDSYMQDPNPDLDGLTSILPELLLPGNQTLQQLVAALRGLQEIIIYVNALPESTIIEMRANVTQVGSDFLFFIEVIRAESSQLGPETKIVQNYLRRAHTYNQRALVRKFANLWDNLESNYNTVTNLTLKPVVEKVMTVRSKVFGR